MNIDFNNQNELFHIIMIGPASPFSNEAYPPETIIRQFFRYSRSRYLSFNFYIFIFQNFTNNV